MCERGFSDIALSLDKLIGEVEEIVDSHGSYIASDDQYDDPQLWWSRPLLEQLKEAREDMDDNR